MDRTQLQLIKAEAAAGRCSTRPRRWTCSTGDRQGRPGADHERQPGFGGQSFIPAALKKIERARKIIDASGRDIRLEVDGGIKVDNIRAAADAGADTFVAGSAIFGQRDYKAVIDAMRARLAR